MQPDRWLTRRPEKGTCKQKSTKCPVREREEGGVRTDGRTDGRCQLFSPKPRKTGQSGRVGAVSFVLSRTWT